jgi:hypothetical protein
MEIFELVDRFEILYPEQEVFADIRRAYIDKDLPSIFRIEDKEELRKAIVEKNIHSIFRCVENKRCVGDLEDLRKAVIEHNLHSLFRILPGNEDLRKAVTEDNMHSLFRVVGNEDLKKVVMDDNKWSLFRLYEKYTDTNFINAFRTFMRDEIPYDSDCFSRGQLQSKLWLVNELSKLDVKLGTVFLCAGWYGTLATMLFESNIDLDKIVSFDIDPTVRKVAEIFNKPWVSDGWKFKAVTQDIHEIRFEEHIYDVIKKDGSTETLWDTPNTVINTSTEHIEDFAKWYEKIPVGTLVIVQNNDYFEIEEHVNCSATLNEFAEKTPMTQELFSGALELSKYKRWMRIGYR